MAKGAKHSSIKITLEGDPSGIVKATSTAAHAVNKLTKELGVSREEAKVFVSNIDKLDRVKGLQNLQSDLKKSQSALAAAKADVRNYGAEWRRTRNAVAKGISDRAKDRVKRHSAQIREQTSALRTSSDALRAVGVSTGDLVGEQRRLTRSISEQERGWKSAAAAARRARQMAEARARADKVAAAVLKRSADQERRAAQARRAAEAVTKKRIAAEKRYQKSLERTRQRLRALRREQRESRSGGGGRGGAGDGVAGIAGVVSAQQGAAAVLHGLAEYAAFDDALRETKAAASLTTEQLEKLKEVAIELGKSPGLTATDMARGMAESARAGMDYVAILDSVAANAQLAAGSELSFAESVESTTDILGQFGLESDSTQKIVDSLILGANSASVKVGQLSEAYSYAGAVANSFGKGLNAVAAQFLVLANSSLKAERGGTSLRAIWSVLLEKSDQFKETFNIDVTEVINGEEKVRDLADIIDDLQRVGMTARQRMELFGKIAGPGIAVFLEKGGDAIRKYQKNLDNAGGSGERVSEILQEGFGGQGFRRVISSFEILVLRLVDSVEPALTAAGSTLADFLTLLGDLPKPVLAGVAAAAALSTAVLGVVSAMTAWSVVGPVIIAQLSTLSASMAGATTVAAGVGAALFQIAAAFAAAIAAYKAGEWLVMHDELAAVAEATARLEQANKNLDEGLVEVAKSTGIVINSWKDFEKAQKDGIIVYNETTGEWEKAEKKKQVVVFKTAEEVKRSADKQKASLAELKKEYQGLVKEIESVEKQLGDLAAEGAASQLELANSSRSPLEAWRAQKKAAQDLGPAMAAAKAEADKLAAAGDIEGANKSYARAVELGKQMRDGFTGLATEVKGNFTPAMQQSLDTASDAAKKFGDQYKQAMDEAKSAGDALKSTTESLAAAEQGLADAQRAAAREGMTAARAYQDLASEQRELEAASKAAAKAGDYDLAIAEAQRARQVASGLNKEIKDGERVVVSAEEAKRNASRAEISARQLEIAALKAKAEAEKKAETEAAARAEKLKAAQEAEAAKEAELAAKKEEVVKTEAEAAKEAAELEAAARQQITEILEAQRDTLQELADQKNAEADWTLGDAYTAAGEEAKRLFEVNQNIQQQLKDIPADAVIDWGSAWSQIEAAGAEAADEVNAKWDNATRDRYITTYVKEVQQRASGGFAGPVQGLAKGGSPRRLSSRYITGGAGGVDRYGPVMLDHKEFVLRSASVKAPELKGDGLSLAWAHNRGDWHGMHSLLSKYIGVDPQISFDIPAPPAELVGGGRADRRGGSGKDQVLVLQDPATQSAARVRGGQVDLDALDRMLKHRGIVSSR